MEPITLKPKGVNRDLAPVETGLDVWNDVANVVFQNGFATSPEGWQSLTGPLIGKPLWMLPVFTPLTFYLVYAGNNADETAGFLAVTDGNTHWDITPAGGLAVTEPSDWTGDVLNGIPVMNNGINPPLWWDLVTVNPATVLPDWPANTTCKALRAFKFHLFALNITQNSVEFPDWTLHSDAADPGTIPQSWTSTPDNQAGSFTVPTGQSGIIDAAQLRDLLVIYKQGSMSLVQFVGGTFIFAVRKAFVQTGILTRNCAQEYFGHHYCIVDGDIIKHNGQEAVSLVDGTARNALFNQINTTAKSAHVAIDHANKQVWFNFPPAGQTYCTTALVWDLTSECFGIVGQSPYAYMVRTIVGDLGQAQDWDSDGEAWDTDQTIWNFQQFNPTRDDLVLCRYDESEIDVMEGFLRDGEESSSRLQLLTKDFGRPDRYKTVDHIMVNAGSTAFPLDEVITARIGEQEHPGDAIRWSPELSLYRNKSVAYGISGRYLSFEFNFRQRNGWRFNSFDVMLQMDGTD